MSGLSYDWIGATLTGGHAPIARRRMHVSFEEAVVGLRQWRCHRAIGATVEPPNAPIIVGSELVARLGIGPFRIAAPATIVGVVDEPDLFGFAYGTRPGHPERGEESFLVERGPDGAVTATITVVAEPAWLAARLVSPAVVALQRWAARRYLRGLDR